MESPSASVEPVAVTSRLSPFPAVEGVSVILGAVGGVLTSTLKVEVVKREESVTVSVIE